MDYVELKERYPVLVNILSNHFEEDVVWGVPPGQLRDRRLSHFLEESAPARTALKHEIVALLEDRLAKEILENERWFVGDFPSEETARDFILEQVWTLYFPDTDVTPDRQR